MAVVELWWPDWEWCGPVRGCGSMFGGWDEAENQKRTLDWAENQKCALDQARF